MTVEPFGGPRPDSSGSRHFVPRAALRSTQLRFASLLAAIVGSPVDRVAWRPIDFGLVWARFRSATHHSSQRHRYSAGSTHEARFLGKVSIAAHSELQRTGPTEERQ